MNKTGSRLVDEIARDLKVMLGVRIAAVKVEKEFEGRCGCLANQ